MSNIKYLLLVLFSFSILSCADNVSSQNQIVGIKKTDVVKESFETNQYAIYNVLLEDEILPFHTSHKPTLIVILKNTNTDYRDNPLLNSVLNNIKNKLPSLSEEMIQSFLQNNKERIPLNDSFKGNINRVFITDEDLKSILEKTQNKDVFNNWDAFYEKYPNSQGVTTFSNVGFDKNMERAFVYVANAKGSLDGVGLYIVLEKQYKFWKIKEKFVGWMS